MDRDRIVWKLRNGDGGNPRLDALLLCAFRYIDEIRFNWNGHRVIDEFHTASGQSEAAARVRAARAWERACELVKLAEDEFERVRWDVTP